MNFRIPWIISRRRKLLGSSIDYITNLFFWGIIDVYYDNKKLVLDSIEAESSQHESFELNLNFNNLGMSRKKRVNFSHDYRLKSINSNFFKTYSKFKSALE